MVGGRRQEAGGRRWEVEKDILQQLLPGVRLVAVKAVFDQDADVVISTYTLAKDLVSRTDSVKKVPKQLYIDMAQSYSCQYTSVQPAGLASCRQNSCSSV